MEPEQINLIVEIVKNSALSEDVALAAIDAWRYSVLLEVIGKALTGVLTGLGFTGAAFGIVCAIGWLATKTA